MQNTVTVKNTQSLLDIAIQSSGSIEAVLELALSNNLSITDELELGMILKTASISSAEVLEHYTVNKISPATASTGTQLVTPQGIDYWAIGIDFIVSKN